MKRHNISLIMILLLSVILIMIGCKNNTKVASEMLATESIIETKPTDFIREVSTASIETETKKPSFWLFLFNRKEYNKQLNEQESSIVEDKDIENTVVEKQTIVVAEETKKSNIAKTKNNKKVVATKSTISNAKFINNKKASTLSNIDKPTNKNIEETFNEVNKTETIVSDEESENIEYIEKVFKKTKDKLNINILIKDANDRNYNKIYEDLIDGKYENTINNFIDNCEGIFNDIKVELNKAKYKDFNKSLANKLKDSKYDKIKSDIEKAIKKYNKETKEVENLIKRLNFKTLILNLNKGKYKSLVNEIKKVIFDSKYDSIREDFINEFVEGEYTEITYDFIYNLLDITYKYKIDIVEETVETTREIVVEETINEVDEVKENKIPIIPIIHNGLVTMMPNMAQIKSNTLLRNLYITVIHLF